MDLINGSSNYDEVIIIREETYFLISNIVKYRLNLLNKLQKDKSQVFNI